MNAKLPNKITGANAGGSGQLPMRTRWAARVAQFWRWAITEIAVADHRCCPFTHSRSGSS